MVEVESFGSGKLDSRKQSDGLAEQFLFFFGERIGDTPLFDGIEKESITQVFLQIEIFVFRYAQYLWHRQVLLLEVFGHVEECFVFFHAGAIYADEALYPQQSEVTTV